MTKAAHILQLYGRGAAVREIAEAVNTSPSYVRTVARQRKGRGQSEHDRRYLESPHGMARVKGRYARLRAKTLLETVGG